MPGHMAHLRAAPHRAVLAYVRFAEISRGERGQTASEYMGILLLVALIVSGLVTLGVPGFIAREISSLIDSISGGNDPRAG
jgi:hypothetical protein